MTTCPQGYGSRSGYQAGCRCDDCADDQRTYMSLYRAGHRTGPRTGPAARPLEGTPWMADRACSPDTAHLFFPGRGEDVTAAKAICDRCQVKATCLDYALRGTEQVGIWGGTSERERRDLRRRMRTSRGAA